MRTTLIFMLLATVFFTAFCQGRRSFDFGVDEKELFKQIATQDSGFLQKREAFADEKDYEKFNTTCFYFF